MTCPSCGGATDVIDSRQSVEATRRRRRCRACSQRFTTYEYDSVFLDYQLARARDENRIPRLQAEQRVTELEHELHGMRRALTESERVLRQAFTEVADAGATR